jgi:hypothetical protein
MAAHDRSRILEIRVGDEHQNLSLRGVKLRDKLQTIRTQHKKVVDEFRDVEAERMICSLQAIALRIIVMDGACCGCDICLA